jgi:glutamate racemase
MSNRHIADAPIGVFDSGVGGLSVLRVMRESLPQEHLIYVADSGHAPYGGRSASFITDRSIAITEQLIAEGAKAIVVACNTASVVAVKALRARYALPIVAMEPAIKPAVTLTKTGVIAVLATLQTIASSAVANLVDRHGGDVDVALVACPGWPERVERHDLSSAATRALLSRTILPLIERGADVLVLGCTHYAFLRPLIEDIAGARATIVDPAPAVVRQLSRQLGANLRRVGSHERARETFYSSAPLEEAQRVMSALWGAELQVHALPRR